MCDPRTDPLDPESDPATMSVKDLTTFKNIRQNAWSDCRRTTFDGFKSSDSNLGMTMKHDSDMVDSVFIGESANLGEPNIVLLKNGTKVLWHRSTPQERGDGRGGFIGMQ